ncbi:hypothetical protein [Sangeribacter muris]|uniref:fimbrial tip adhesin FimD n=1 Tax=Sangeribacter muris TaxID=2880703 RepID=UPI00244E29DD|nr:hypothetical protein [Sangeribacter muris]
MRLINFKNIVFGFLSCAMLCGGCSDAMEDIIDAPSESLTLRFYSAGAGTRADIESSDASLNENLISNLAVAFYPSAASDSKNAVKFNLFKNLGATGKVERKIIISDEEVALLFGSTETSGATCRVYALANLSDEEIAALGKTPTVAAMKELRVSSEFDTQQVQESFVMSGDATVTYNIDASGKKTAVGNVQLVRSAAKITLNIKLPESYEDPGTGNIWEPIASPATGAMRVLLNNGVKNSRVLVPQEGYDFKDEDYFNITTADATYGFVDNRVNNSEYPNKQKVPFYTYPNRWENTPGERHRTALTLIVPWHNTTTNTYQTFYYRVPVTPAEMPGLVSNHSYQIDLNVGMLGSAMPETPVEITGNYRVVDWARETIDVNIKDYRYLVVSPTTYRMDNTEDFTLNFYSSHPVEVDDITMTYQRFSYITETGNSEMGTVVYFPTSKEVIDRSVTPDGIKMVEYSENITTAPNSKQYSFSLKHKLEVWTPLDKDGIIVPQTGYRNLSDTTNIQNSIQKYLRSDSPEPAYSPYTFKVTLRHKDNPEFKASFTVVQYPAMYIQADKNPGGEYRTSPLSSSSFGYVFVNPEYTPAGRFIPAYWTNSSDLGGVHGITSNATNKNPNMYVINLTALSGNYESYIIGDPRALNVNNNLVGNPGQLTAVASPTIQDWAVEAEALYNESNQKRRLQWYYPTQEGSSTRNMIAPKIRVASSYGVCNNGTSTQNLRRRCASYQEQGFPAGRWRVPTYSEVEFIVKLSTKGIIPLLFTKGATYLTAQGFVRVEDDDKGSITLLTNTTSGSVRAVYDEWYWEKETNYVLQNNSSGGYDFTWGDMPMRNPQN